MFFTVFPRLEKWRNGPPRLHTLTLPCQKDTVCSCKTAKAGAQKGAWMSPGCPQWRSHSPSTRNDTTRRPSTSNHSTRGSMPSSECREWDFQLKEREGWDQEGARWSCATTGKNKPFCKQCERKWHQMQADDWADMDTVWHLAPVPGAVCKAPWVIQTFDTRWALHNIGETAAEPFNGLYVWNTWLGTQPSLDVFFSWCVLPVAQSAVCKNFIFDCLAWQRMHQEHSTSWSSFAIPQTDIYHRLLWDQNPTFKEAEN